MTTVFDVTQAAERLWPLTGAEDWDRPGLVAGSFQSPVTKVLLSVDVTLDLIDDAIAGGFDLILSHHPFLLRGVTSVAEDTAKGLVLSKAIRSGIALYSAHTNADITETGVSATLASTMGLVLEGALSPLGQQVGHGRIGNLTEAMPLVNLARVLAQTLPATAGGVLVAGDANRLVKRIAVCGGAGDSFIADAVAAGVDAYVTSDLRHHPTQDGIESARARGGELALISVSHWAAESLWLKIAAKELENLVPGVKFEVSDLRTDPWDFAVTQ